MNPAVSEILGAASSVACLPWPRHLLTHDTWTRLLGALADDRSLMLAGLWADTAEVHLLMRNGDDTPLLVSTPVAGGEYPAVSPICPAAVVFERMVHDLWGHIAAGAADMRPWLDHGRWPCTQPLSSRPGPAVLNPEAPEFQSASGLTQLPIGPVDGLVHEPAHLRLSIRGDWVHGAECRLGYAHKGTLSLLSGKSPRNAARFAARLAGDATVAHALAFARAAEAAAEVEVPPRAAAIRDLMEELERTACNLDVIAITLEAAGGPALPAVCGRSIELLRRAAAVAFGHRLMMDCVVPGGLAADIAPGGQEAIRRVVTQLAPELLKLRRRLSLWKPRMAGVGVVQHTSGQDWPGQDCWSRTEARLTGLEESVRLLQGQLDALPEGAASVPLPPAIGEGIGSARSVRGEVWHWLRLDHGQISAAFCVDPAWILWRLAETALANSGVENVAMIRASFGLSVSGADL